MQYGLIFRVARDLESLRSTLRSMRHQQLENDCDNNSTLKSHSTLRSGLQHQMSMPAVIGGGGGGGGGTIKRFFKRNKIIKNHAGKSMF